MESVFQVILYAAALWVWVWLVRVVRYDIPAAIYFQQNLGLSTPWPFYLLTQRWRWLAVGGLVAGAASLLVPEIRAGVVVCLLAVAVGLLTYIQQVMARFVAPRFVDPILRAMRMPRSGDGPDEPLPAA